MNPTHSANQPQSSKEYRVIVKKRRSSAKYFLSLNQPQSTTSERFFVKQPQIRYGVRAGYLGTKEMRKLSSKRGSSTGWVSHRQMAPPAFWLFLECMSRFPSAKRSISIFRLG